MNSSVRHLLASLCVSLFSVVACSHAVKQRPLSLPEPSPLASQISHLRYHLWFALNGSYPEYEGRAVILFRWKGNSAKNRSPLALQFQEGSLSSVRINHVSLTESEIRDSYVQNRIHLNSTQLLSGQNRLEISFTRNYAGSGEGIVRFQDPSDQTIYLFTRAGRSASSSIFPCFDDPNFKAIYEVTVEAPSDWKVLANAADRDITVFDGRASWSFSPTQPLSSASFSLHAGPYEEWKNDFEGTPLRFFARRSIKERVDPEEWIKVTRSGLYFFNQLLGLNYPFTKYDQVLIPEESSSELTGFSSSTISESSAPFVTRTDSNSRETSSKAILYRISQNWFGHFVSALNWDDFKFHDGLARYLSILSLETISSRIEYFLRKPWTKPFRENPGFLFFTEKNPSRAIALFRQLYLVYGESRFKENLQTYLRKNAYGHADLNDFLTSFEYLKDSRAQESLIEQLKASRLPEIRAELSCDADARKISRFEIIQTLYSPTTSFRFERQTKVALYDRRSKILGAFTVSYSGERTSINELINKPCPNWINLNHEDHDFAQVILDPRTFEIAEKVSQPEHPLRKTLSPLTIMQFEQSLNYQRINESRARQGSDLSPLPQADGATKPVDPETPH